MARFLTLSSLVLSLASFQGQSARQGAPGQPPQQGVTATPQQMIPLLADTGKIDDALAQYDAYVKAHANQPSDTLLAVIARAQLRAMAGGGDAVLASEARERLAAGGDQAALKALRDAAASGSGDTAAAATASLLRLGDRATVQHITEALQGAPPERRAELIEIVQHGNVKAAAPAVVRSLGDESPQVRMMAAQTAGVLGATDAVPKLQDLYEHDSPLVKMYAAIALKRLGQHTADAFVAGLLASDVPETRMIAADAYAPAESKEWLPRVRELRNNPNDLVRLKVAETLACCDVPTARTILSEVLNSPIPPVRMEAARVFERTDVADARIARRLMGDGFPGVQLHGAGIAVKLNARPAAAPKRSGR